MHTQTKKETVLIAGGSGFIGRHLSEYLIQNGFDVIVLTRRISKREKFETAFWNPNQNQIDLIALQKADYLINMAGENIGAQRWTKKRMEKIKSSRVNSTHFLSKQILKNGIHFKSILQFSAVGYYGYGDVVRDESDLSGNSFLANVCVEWEKAAEDFKQASNSFAVLRCGVVIGKDGGMIEQLNTSARFGLLPVPANGRQFISWIHIHDLCRLILYLITEKRNGLYNAVAPELVSFNQFANAWQQVTQKYLFKPNVPHGIFKLLLGNLADELCNSTSVRSKKLEAENFQFRYPNIKSALQQVLKNKKAESLS